MVDTTEIRVQMTREGNMTIIALARAIDVAPATLTRWLKKGDMPISYAEKIGIALNIPRERWGSIFFSSSVA